VQLRRDNLAGTLYNIVGFQTNITWPAQTEVLRLIPGLQNAQFVRLGQMHRNTFVNAPVLLEPTMQFRQRKELYFAGQITGVEGYMGNVATGLLAAINLARHLNGETPLILPPTTMLGALCHYVSHADPKHFQPMKANLGILPDLPHHERDKSRRKVLYAERAHRDLLAALSALNDAYLNPSLQTSPVKES
jgi:methylenetetrahydrofolate--tRNA-(uracil-5-)-methyltransferase